MATSWTTTLTRREQETAENIRGATARLLALVGDHVDADWYVRVVEADTAGRIALFADAVDRLPESSIGKGRELVEERRLGAADAVEPVELVGRRPRWVALQARPREAGT